MILEETNRDIQQRKAPHLDDLSAIHEIRTSSIRSKLFKEQWYVIFWIAFVACIRFQRSLLGFMHWNMVATNPGKKTIGLVFVILSTLMMLGYNCASIPLYLKPFGSIALIVLPFFKSKEEMIQMTLIDVESTALLTYTGMFILLGLFNLIRVWVTGGNKSMTKRGDHFLVTLLSRWMSVNEYFIAGIVQPMIFTVLGLFVWKQLNDVYFGWFLIATSLSEALQLLVDKSYQAHIDGVLKA